MMAKSIVINRKNIYFIDKKKKIKKRKRRKEKKKSIIHGANAAIKY